jgi:hypothetical protein
LFCREDSTKEHVSFVGRSPAYVIVTPLVWGNRLVAFAILVLVKMREAAPYGSKSWYEMVLIFDTSRRIPESAQVESVLSPDTSE